ncbi:MAG TPA: DNA-directed DNA polymerase II small subunit, partial [Candidatus Thermoplasmatota archaeon]|nr:DNA-directed DNA polymerase II small subunit [Candidatus Thermoplasmatota archaeon]
LGDLTTTPLRIIPGEAAPFPVEGFDHKWTVDGDVTGQSTSEGLISDFTRYFNDRLARIRKMLRQRREMVGCVPIKAIRPGAQAEIKIVGIVTEVRTTKNGHRLIELEDETGTQAILAPASDHRIIQDAQTLIEDEVVGVVCKAPSKGDLLILQSIVRPEIPQGRTPNRGDRGAAVAFVSDVHFGAKTFLQEDWDRFIRWINGTVGDSRQRALARKVKYLVVVGDLVDGIGIFPGQEDELSIVDGMGQYQYAGEQLARIRQDVKIFVLPGNHDLVRPAEPQPAFPDKYRKCFDERVVHIGNPCRLQVEGVEILNYHGRSFDDWIMRVQGLTYQEPLAAMEEMLKRRHVLPVYGLRTPIAPEHKDYLVIDSVPDIFVTGHVHSAGIKNYRGVTLINSSCWQSQTSYQKMHGFNPEPSKVPVVELDNGRTWMMDFHLNRPAGIDANPEAAHMAIEGGLSGRNAKPVLPSVEF